MPNWTLDTGHMQDNAPRRRKEGINEGFTHGAATDMNK